MIDDVRERMRGEYASRVVILIGLLLAGTAVPGGAQSEGKKEGDASVVETGAGFFAVGGHEAALDNVNTRLRAAGYPAVSTTLVAVGGGGYGVVADRFLVGGEGYGLVGPSRTAGGRTITAGGGYGVFTFGYQFRPTPRWRLHPLLGVGGGGVQLKIGSAGAADFDDVLRDPDRSATVTRGSLLVSLGAGAEYRFLGAPNNGGLQVGLRAGYVWAPSGAEWELDGESLAGGPDATLSGPYVRIHVGGWGG